MNFQKVLIFMGILILRGGGGGGDMGQAFQGEGSSLGCGVPEIKMYVYRKQRKKQSMENCKNNVFQMCGYKNSRF